MARSIILEWGDNSAYLGSVRSVIEACDEIGPFLDEAGLPHRVQIIQASPILRFAFDFYDNPVGEVVLRLRFGDKVSVADIEWKVAA